MDGGHLVRGRINAWVLGSCRLLNMGMDRMRRDVRGMRSCNMVDARCGMLCAVMLVVNDNEYPIIDLVNRLLLDGVWPQW
jgi:hypothetical protein